MSPISSRSKEMLLNLGVGKFFSSSSVSDVLADILFALLGDSLEKYIDRAKYIILGVLDMNKFEHQCHTDTVETFFPENCQN